MFREQEVFPSDSCLLGLAKPKCFPIYSIIYCISISDAPLSPYASTPDLASHHPQKTPRPAPILVHRGEEGLHPLRLVGRLAELLLIRLAVGAAVSRPGVWTRPTHGSGYSPSRGSTERSWAGEDHKRWGDLIGIWPCSLRQPWGMHSVLCRTRRRPVRTGFSVQGEELFSLMMCVDQRLWMSKNLFEDNFSFFGFVVSLLVRIIIHHNPLWTQHWEQMKPVRLGHSTLARFFACLHKSGKQWR